MTKSWSEQPLWQKCWMREDRLHLAVAKIIGHAGCSIGEFWDKAKKLPNYDKYKVENVVGDLTVWSLRQPPQLKLELTATALKILHPLLGPPPGDPTYAGWWTVRLVSVAEMRERGEKVTHAEHPPVPIPGLTEPHVPGKTKPKEKPTQKAGKKPAKETPKKPARKKSA
jgi:hypothetical protein